MKLFRPIGMLALPLALGSVPPAAMAHGPEHITVLQCWAAGAQVACRVRESDGKARPDVRIEVRGGDAGVLQAARTDAQGHVRFARPDEDFHVLLHDGRGNTQELRVSDIAATRPAIPEI
ncbi:MAG: hypothetical protein H3C26_11960 [Rhodocyclaceae bacterium]|nr:hypothetical protein [Rhodocyclaceae bacterium]